MVDLATPEFLSFIKTLYPASQCTNDAVQAFFDNPSYLVAAVTFSASNCPEAVASTFKHALEELETYGATDAQKVFLVRRFQEAIFKSGMICGLPRTINALNSLYKVLPRELPVAEPLRDPSSGTEDLMRSGKGHFDLTYGETADATRLMLTQCHPDLEFLIAFVYGYVYSFSQVLSGTETAFIIIAALVASDAPLQLAWHMQGAKRHGVNRDQIRAVRGMAMLVASRAGVSWMGELPDFLESDVSP